MNPKQGEGSHFFLVRFWSDSKQSGEDGQGHMEWSGRVQHVLSGEAHSFGDWTTLVSMMLEMARTEAIEVEGLQRKATEVSP